jgi:hypothetical protein
MPGDPTDRGAIWREYGDDGFPAQPEAGVRESDWVSAHVFYQGDLTELVVDGAAPLVREMVSGGLASGWFFLRYWEGGTHLRLRVLPAGGDGNGDAVRALLTERLGRYLRERPSAELMQPAEYARLAPVLAARERMPSYAETMYPNNSVVFLPYRREHGRYGHGASVEAVERHFVESSRLAAALLAGRRRRDGVPAAPSDAVPAASSDAGPRGAVAGEGWPGRRDTIAFSLILLTWLVCQPDPARLAEAGGGLYRAWGRGLDALDGLDRDVEDGDVAEGDGAGVDEADFDERYRRQRDKLVGLTRGVRDTAARLPHQAGRGVLGWWGTSVLRLRNALAHEVAAGRFTPPRLGHQPASASSPTATGDLHGRVLPVLDICAHLLCNRLGISLLDEAYLRYLAISSAAALAGGADGAR